MHHNAAVAVEAFRFRRNDEIDVPVIVQIAGRQPVRDDSRPYSREGVEHSGAVTNIPKNVHGVVLIRGGEIDESIGVEITWDNEKGRTGKWELNQWLKRELAEIVQEGDAARALARRDQLQVAVAVEIRSCNGTGFSADP